MQQFGEKLRILRKRHHMTIIELAAALGYTANSYISELETEKNSRPPRWCSKWQNCSM